VDSGQKDTKSQKDKQLLFISILKQLSVSEIDSKQFNSPLITDF